MSRVPQSCDAYLDKIMCICDRTADETTDAALQILLDDIYNLADAASDLLREGKLFNDQYEQEEYTEDF